MPATPHMARSQTKSGGRLSGWHDIVTCQRLVCYTSPRPLYGCWLKIVVFVLITLQTTLIYRFCSPTPYSCTELQSRILSVSMLLPAGCNHTGSSSTLPKRKSSGCTGRRSHLLPQQPLRVGSNLVTPVFRSISHLLRHFPSSAVLLSLEDILLRTLLPVITVVVPAKWHCHLWTR